MNKAYLLIGGNTGDRLKNMEEAVEWIEKRAGMVKTLSSLYETAAWGKTDQPNFFNQALEIDTPLEAPELLTCLLQIELDMGRIREEKYGPRIIDIDILFFNAEIHHLPQLSIPHPEVQNRRFALLPMVEIAPHFIHPLLQQSMEMLLANCSDPLQARKLETE